MTNGDEFEIFEAERWPHERFQCECGNVTGADEMTECKRCGAWYERDGDVMVQKAPPAGKQ